MQRQLADEPILAGSLVASGRGWAEVVAVAAKGAPEAVASLCHLDAVASSAFLRAADQLASEGLRILEVACSLPGAPLHPELSAAEQQNPPAGVHDFLFEPVGLVGLADPLRRDVPLAIARARSAGVRVVMITGDGPQTARAIADQAGLPPGAVLCGTDLEALPRGALAAEASEVNVFARVRPQQKLQLVRSLQAAGEVVAMTGDGVNDALALKAADIGVAMGQRGTAVWSRYLAACPAAGRCTHPGGPGPGFLARARHPWPPQPGLRLLTLLLAATTAGTRRCGGADARRAPAKQGK